MKNICSIGIHNNSYKNCAHAVHLIYYSKLLFNRIDDIQDGSVLRRGIPVAHSIYGVASTINAANYVMFIALEKVVALKHPKVNLIL